MFHLFPTTLFKTPGSRSTTTLGLSAKLWENSKIDRTLAVSRPPFQDYNLFVEEFKESGGIWVMKPSGAAEGRGIFLFAKLSAVHGWAKPHLARRMKRYGGPAHLFALFLAA